MTEKQYPTPKNFRLAMKSASVLQKGMPKPQLTRLKKESDDMPSKKKNPESLEKMLERLDEISIKLDSDLPLDEALSLYEEGVGLIKAANKLIEEAEVKIKTLDPKNNDEVQEND
jgi:exodeoxyribonuclease VII small subunit